MPQDRALVRWGRQAQFKSGIREAAPPLTVTMPDADLGKTVGEASGVTLPGFNCAEDAFNAVDPVRFEGTHSAATITLVTGPLCTELRPCLIEYASTRWCTSAMGRTTVSVISYSE